MKVVLADTKLGKCWQVELAKEKAGLLIGKKIGDQIEGDLLGAPGYLLQLTGGSDGSGFPMRSDVSGSRKEKLLLSRGVGFKGKRKGMRKRKTIRGNAYSGDIIQVNVKVVQNGSVPLEELFGKKEGKKEEEKK